MSWERARQKFERLAEPTVDAGARERSWPMRSPTLDELETRDLTALLERARGTRDDERSSR